LIEPVSAPRPWGYEDDSIVILINGPKNASISCPLDGAEARTMFETMIQTINPNEENPSLTFDPGQSEEPYATDPYDPDPYEGSA
jgi:hypothetical protein